MRKNTRCPARTNFTFLCKHNLYEKHTAVDTEAGEKHTEATRKQGLSVHRLQPQVHLTVEHQHSCLEICLWAAPRAPLCSKKRLNRGEQNFKYILRDRALRFFPKHKFTSYKQMTIKHLYITNVKAASYGTHSLTRGNLAVLTSYKGKTI